MSHSKVRRLSKATWTAMEETTLIILKRDSKLPKVLMLSRKTNWETVRVKDTCRSFKTSRNTTLRKIWSSLAVPRFNLIKLDRTLTLLDRVNFYFSQKKRENREISCPKSKSQAKQTIKELLLRVLKGSTKVTSGMLLSRTQTTRFTRTTPLAHGSKLLRAERMNSIC